MKFHLSSALRCSARIAVGIFLLVTVFAEWITNDRPVFMIQTQQISESKSEMRIFFPAYRHYGWSDFGMRDEGLLVDYSRVSSRFRFDPLFSFSPTHIPDSMDQGRSLLGSDSLGRDVFSRMIYGIRWSVGFGFLFAVGSLFLGLIVGGAQGYVGGRLDFGIERVKEVLESVPYLVIVLVVNGFMAKTNFGVMLTLSVALAWMKFSHQVRIEMMRLREMPYVEASRAMGSQTLDQWRNYFFPNLFERIKTVFPFQILAGMSLLTSLDFLGFGLSPPTPTLGGGIQEGIRLISQNPAYLISHLSVLILMLVAVRGMGRSTGISH